MSFKVPEKLKIKKFHLIGVEGHALEGLKTPASGPKGARVRLVHEAGQLLETDSIILTDRGRRPRLFKSRRNLC